MKTICLDFDGVIHSYKSGWKGELNIPDPIVPGAIDFIKKAYNHFSVCIFSSRSKTFDGRMAMIVWLAKQAGFDPNRPMEWPDWFHSIRWPIEKPPAVMYIDDRGWRFDGTFPSIEEIQEFKSWVEK